MNSDLQRALAQVDDLIRRPRLKPHVYRELVNRLRDCAVTYHNHQSLRERLNHVLGDVIGVDTPFATGIQAPVAAPLPVEPKEEKDVPLAPPSPQVVATEKIVEKIVEVEKVVEKPVEKVVTVEVPVERVVEVDRIVEVEKLVEVKSDDWYLELLEEGHTHLSDGTVVRLDDFAPTGSPFSPIATAPKDGTHLLLYRNGDIAEAWWREDLFGKPCWGGKSWSYPVDSQPTHWMHLPKKPDTE